MRIGYMGNEPIRDILMSNLVITGGEAVLDVLCCGGSDGFCAHGRHYTGPRIENIHLSNVAAENVKWGITINANSSLGATGSVGHFRFDRVNIRSSYGNYISGTADHPIADMLFRDCSFLVAGGHVDSTSLPAELPLFKSRTFAFAWLARHASHIRFLNCNLQCPDSFQTLVQEHCNDLIHDFQNCD